MSTESLPETIGKYKIISKLGQGGMGAIYRAMQETLGRPIALKVLPPEFTGNEEYIQRFLREARTIAALRHENIVQVYDAGEQQGQYYIAMELVDGCNLAQYCQNKQQKVSEAEGLALLMQAAKGLAAAHAKELVHRDIKPENLLLDKDNLLRIVDFGLVMESQSTTQLTATGACLGTPAYMSPEQVDGERADQRSDLYSLGASFFQVFTGEPPFSSPTAMNLLYKHKFEAPPNPRTLRPELSADVSNLLLRLLAKRREDRPQSARALVEMLEGLKQGRHISPPPPTAPAAQTTLITPGSPLSKPFRKRLLAAAAALLMLGALLFLVFNHQRTGSGAVSAGQAAQPETGAVVTNAGKEQHQSSAKPPEAGAPSAANKSADSQNDKGAEWGRKAAVAEQAGNFKLAAEYYQNAAAETKDPESTAFTEKAIACGLKVPDLAAEAERERNKTTTTPTVTTVKNTGDHQPLAPAAQPNVLPALTTIVDSLVGDKKDAEALAKTTEALRSAPANLALRDLKAALELLQYCNAAVAVIEGNGQALDKIRAAQKIDKDDTWSDERLDALKDLREELRKISDELRRKFPAHDYAAVRNDSLAVRDCLQKIKHELNVGAEKYNEKAKSNQPKKVIGFIPSGDKEKADKYENLSEDFKDLAKRIKELITKSEECGGQSAK